MDMSYSNRKIAIFALRVIIVLYLGYCLYCSYSTIGSVLLLISYVFTKDASVFAEYLVRSSLVMLIWALILQIIPYFRNFKIWLIEIVCTLIIICLAYPYLCCWKIESKGIIDFCLHPRNQQLPISLCYICLQLFMVLEFLIASLIYKFRSKKTDQ